MLVGSTFAWFTDSVKTGINTIAAGVLDVELYHSNAAVQNEQVNSNTKLFMDLQGSPILWEPGVVSFENLRVANAGDLALTYQLALATDNENYIIDGNNQYGLSQILQVGVVEGGITATDRDGVVGAVTEWTTLASFLRSGSLLAAGEETWGVVVYWQPGEDDNRWNLNNGKTLNEGEALQIDLGVKLIATQEMEESDSIDKTYDENAKAEFFDGFQGGSAGAVVTADDQGITTAEVAMKGGDVSAVIPTGVQVASGVNSLALTVTKKAASEANIQLKENEEMRPLDVHIEGVAQGNTVPMLITLKHYLSTGINTGALTLYHVENGQTVAMTQVANPANHNEFSYDPATGDVTLALASFSEVAVVADTNNPWDGETINTLWYDASRSELTISNADQLAGFAAIVDGKAEGIAQDSFAGKTVKLANNITLSGKLFEPIGWGYVNSDWNSGGKDGNVFQGTFDGNGKVIIDLYQNGWDLEAENGTDYTYTNCGFGLFAAASGASFKNLTISGADVKTECVEMGVLVGLSQNNCTYENIKIFDSKIANYQRPAGGLIGEVSGTGTTTITNVTIGSNVVVGSLWGDFDAPVGGVIGARWDDVGADPQIKMTNVEVGARMDVYSDVTSAYQWYAYRRAGMLIGNTELTDPNNAHLAAAPFLTCTKVKVYYDDWAAYHYCQFTNQDNAWCNNYPWVRVEAGENCSAYSNVRYGQPVVGGVAVSTDTHTCTGEHKMELRFNQLYGGGQGVYGQPAHDGVEVVNYRYSITYINDYEVLAITYVTEDGAVSTANAAAQDLVVKWANKNIGEGKFAFGGWMNAGSTKLTEIDANNADDIVLYPYFNNPYTARFVDLQGNVIAYCFFHEEDTTKLAATLDAAKAALPAPDVDTALTGWQVRYKDEDAGKNIAEDFDEEKFKSYEHDVTVYPVYTYTGNLKLTPIDTENDGIIDYYRVDATQNLSGTVNVPGVVNGIPVAVVQDLCYGSNILNLNTGLKKVTFGEGVERIESKAIAFTSSLSEVDLPSSLEYIGKNVFASDGFISGGVASWYKTITINYNGTKAQWEQVEKANGWNNNVKKITVVCTDGNITYN